MNLPNNFSFSQHNLQDFVDCPRRFLLKYIQKVAWPAIQSEPVRELERHMDLGIRFHKIIHQMYLGMDRSILVNEDDEIELKIWIQNHLAVPELWNFQKCFPETTLTATLSGYRIIAKFDLIAVTKDGDLRILDWKTSKRKPNRGALQNRLQTRIYPWVLYRSLEKLIPGIKYQPSQISMIYWFADYPGDKEIFSNDQAKLDEDEGFLSTLIGSISATPTEGFYKTTDERMCRFCSYRSYCDRGTEAGDLSELDDISSVDDSLNVSFSDVEEIQF